MTDRRYSLPIQSLGLGLWLGAMGAAQAASDPHSHHAPVTTQQTPAKGLPSAPLPSPATTTTAQSPQDPSLHGHSAHEKGMHLHTGRSGANMQGGPAPMNARDPDEFSLPKSFAEAHELAHEMGPQRYGAVELEHLEWQRVGGESALLGEVQASYGSARQRIGLDLSHRQRGQHLQEQTLQLYWQRPLAVFWDGQVGVLRDQHDTGPARYWLMAGVDGTAPYEVAVSAQLRWHPDQQALALSAQRDLRLEQRWVLGLGLESLWQTADGHRPHGYSSVRNESGWVEGSAHLQLRWEWRRNLTPYLRGFVEHTADRDQEVGLAAGLAMWF